MSWVINQTGFSEAGFNRSTFPGTEPANFYTGPPPGFDPLQSGGRIPARWTWPYLGFSQPLLEMPQNRIARISLAMDAWLGEPIINSSSKLITGMMCENLTLTVRNSMWTKMPPWIPEREREHWAAEYGENFREMASAYVEKRCWSLCKQLSLIRFMTDSAMDMLISGDAFINIASNCKPEEERLVRQAGDIDLTEKAVEDMRNLRIKTGRSPEYKILAMQGLNPSAAWVYPDFTGRIVDAKIIHLLGEGTYSVDLDNLIHLKADGFNWTTYGVSAYLSALQWVNIKFKLMEALFVNASRYVSPREWLTVKGPETPDHATLPPTPQQMKWAEYILQYYAADQAFVLPDGWSWNYLGAEGKVLKIEPLVEMVNDAIRTTCQISPTFSSGSAKTPAFATSKLQIGMMYKTQDKMRKILNEAVEGRIMHRYVEMNGWNDVDGEPLTPSVNFYTRPVQGDDTIEKRIATLAPMGYLSPQTAWEMVGLDVGQEYQRILDARKGLIRTGHVISPDMSPSNDPQRHLDPEDSPFRYLRARGHKRVMGGVDAMLGNTYSVKGTQKALESHTASMLEYLAQGGYLTANRGKDPVELEEVLREKGGKGDTLRKNSVITRTVGVNGTSHE